LARYLLLKRYDHYSQFSNLVVPAINLHVSRVYDNIINVVNILEKAPSPVKQYLMAPYRKQTFFVTMQKGDILGPVSIFWPACKSSCLVSAGKRRSRYMQEQGGNSLQAIANSHPLHA
jgi:hypothetical protein